MAKQALTPEVLAKRGAAISAAIKAKGPEHLKARNEKIRKGHDNPVSRYLCSVASKKCDPVKRGLAISEALNSPEVKSVLSLNLINRLKNPDDPFSKNSGAKRSGSPGFYNNVWMRSKFEREVASALDSMGIKWEYESRIISKEDGTNYVPDFYLPDYDLLVEVKPKAFLKELDSRLLFYSKNNLKCAVITHPKSTEEELRAYIT